MKQKVKILLADNSRFFRAIERQFLQKIPVEIFEADSSETALTVIREKVPDLVYMAFTLPKEGGVKCCQEVRKDPDISSVPVVIVCDQGIPEQVEIARKHGCNACLVKPLDRYNFLQAGRQFLIGIREHRQASFFPVFFAADASGEEFQGKCLDISGGGMFIDTPVDIPVGTILSLTFKLADEMSTKISCKAVASWLNRKPNPMKPHYPHGFGVQFTDLPELMRKAIQRLTDKNLSTDKRVFFW